MKVFGAIAGIHVLVILAIFAIPGCSSSTKPPPAPSDTVARTEAAPSLSLPPGGVTPPAADPGFTAAAAPAFDPNAVATSSGAATGSSMGVRFNPTRPNTPAAGAVNVEPVQDVTPATTYVVVNGDSLWTIAKKNHLSAPELAAANNLKTSAVLRPGQKLLIPGKATSTTAAVAADAAGGGPAKPAANGAAVMPGAAKANSEVVKHTVRTGETLSQIAKQYGVKQSELGAANHISDPKTLQAGTELVIPGWQATNGKAAKAPAKGDTKKSAPPTLNVEDPAPANPSGALLDSPFTPAPKK